MLTMPMVIKERHDVDHHLPVASKTFLSPGNCMIEISHWEHMVVGGTPLADNGSPAFMQKMKIFH